MVIELRTIQVEVDIKSHKSNYEITERCANGNKAWEILDKDKPKRGKESYLTI